MAFVVYNTSKKIVILSDLRAEIGPSKIIDLEKVARIEDVRHSRDLFTAVNSKKLKIIKRDTFEAKQAFRQTFGEDMPVDEVALERAIENVMSRQKRGEGTLDKALEQRISRKLDQTADRILSKLNDKEATRTTERPAEDPSIEETTVDPEVLAGLQQKNVERLSEKISSSNQKPGKKTRIRNPKIDQLADELGQEPNSSIMPK